MSRQLWNVRCRATKPRSGLPCKAWAIRGGYTCRVHGSGSRKARDRATWRLEQERGWLRALRELQKALAPIIADPEAARAEALAGLAALRERPPVLRRQRGSGWPTMAG